ncbi:MAG TPA: hypothetical protein VFY93_03100 [Planctomycetota bacterium]|nr:hypothetical protein [Planctomycetota bacterium]
MRMRWGLCLLALSVAAAADDTEEFGRALVLAITKNTGLPDVAKRVDEGVVEQLAMHPAVARDVCAAAAKYVYRAGGARTDWELLVQHIVLLGKKTMERLPEDADAVLACAEAELCRLRLACALERATTSEDWIATAELFVKAHGIRADDGKPLERAAGLLQEGTDAIGVDRNALRDRADKVCEEAVRQYPESKLFRGMLFRRRLDKIEEQLVSDRRGAQKALADYVDELRAKMDDKGTDMVVATAYTDAVTFARSTRGISLKADYITRTLSVARSNLRVDIPVSERWEYEDGVIRQYDRDGDHLRSFTFDVYSWDTNYYIGQTMFGGDNLKGLAALDELNAEQLVVKIEKRRKPTRRRLNGKFASTVYFEVSGFDADGDFLRYANYYMKTEKRCSVQVSLLEYQELEDVDPETKSVIDSFRESD